MQQTEGDQVTTHTHSSISALHFFFLNNSLLKKIYALSASVWLGRKIMNKGRRRQHNKEKKCRVDWFHIEQWIMMRYFAGHDPNDNEFIFNSFELEFTLFNERENNNKKRAFGFRTGICRLKLLLAFLSNAVLRMFFPGSHLANIQSIEMRYCLKNSQKCYLPGIPDCSTIDWNIRHIRTGQHARCSLGTWAPRYHHLFVSSFHCLRYCWALHYEQTLYRPVNIKRKM